MICTGFALGFVILHCDEGKRAADSFCQVYRSAIHNELRLTADEVKGLRRGTKADLAALKETYRRRCVEKAAKTSK